MSAAPEIADAGAAGGTPLALRRLAGPVALLQHGLAAPMRPLMAEAAGAQVAVTLDAPRPPADGVPWLAGTLDGDAFAVQLPWGVARRLSGVPVEGGGARDGAVLVEAGLAPWLDAAEAELGVTLRLEALAPILPDGLPVFCALSLRGRDTGKGFVQMRQVLALSDGAAAALARVVAARPAPSAAMDGLALRVAAGWPAMTIRAADLRALRPGDAVVLDDAAPVAAWVEGRLHAVAVPVPGGMALAAGARFAAQAIRQGDVHGGGREVAMQDERDSGATVAAGQGAAGEGDDGPALDPAALDEVELRLVFRAGEARMSLGALRALGAGGVVATGDPANAVVEIAVNDRVIGTGELIDIDGLRAVQIRSLSAER